MKRSTGGASSARASASRTAPTSRAAPSVAARRTTAATAPTTSAPTSTATNAKLAALQAENTELKLAVERTEQEREFYFEKLQDVEFLCQRAEFANNTLTKVVEKILYFTEGKPDIEAIIAECEAECRAAAPVAPETREPAREPAMVAAKSEEEEEEVTTPTVAEAAAVALELAAEEPAAPSSAETVAAAANEELDVTADADCDHDGASPHWLARNRRRRPRCLPSPRRRRRWNPRVRWTLRRRRVSPCRRSRSTCETTSVDERCRARIRRRSVSGDGGSAGGRVRTRAEVGAHV